MTIEKIIELVSNSDLKDNSELISVLGTLINPETINLDLINKDEKFADLLKSIKSFSDKKTGLARTEWDRLKLEEIEKVKNSFKTPKGDEPPKDEIKELLKQMFGKIEALENKNSKEAKIISLTTKAKDLTKDLSKLSQKRILSSLNSEMTEENLTEIVNDYNEFEKSFKKSGSPGDPPDNNTNNKPTVEGKKAFDAIKAELETKD